MHPWFDVRSSYASTLVPRADEVPAYLKAQFTRIDQGIIPFARVRSGINAEWRTVKAALAERLGGGAATAHSRTS